MESTVKFGKKCNQCLEEGDFKCMRFKTFFIKIKLMIKIYKLRHFSAKKYEENFSF